MITFLLILLIVISIYILIDWLRRRKTFNQIATHRNIAWHIWAYCAFLIVVCIIMDTFCQIVPEAYRPRYGEYTGRYFPYGYFSDLRIGSIYGTVTSDNPGHLGFNFHYHAMMMHRHWDEIETPDSISPYYSVLQSIGTYDNEPNSKTFGLGIALYVYDLTENVIGTNGNEEKAYEKLIKKQVNDSSFMHRTKSFTPYKAIATPTYMIIDMGENGTESVLFQKHITIFANERAYALTFVIDREFERPDSLNSFDYLNDIFINTAKELDLHSYHEWREDEAKYNHYLHIKCWIYIGLYLLCLVGSLYIAFRYFKNAGPINPKAAKWCKILSVVDLTTFAILGISFACAFCTIQHTYINEMYDYRFAAYINDKHAATSILCYGAYFLLLIIPTNRIYLQSYTLPKVANAKAKSKTKHRRNLLFWIVRPFALMTKWGQRFSKLFKEEYLNQMSDLDKNDKQ